MSVTQHRREVAEQMQEYLHIDTSGADDDTLEVLEGGTVRTVHLKTEHYSSGVLPNGTRFTPKMFGIAFEQAHIKAYGVCLMDIDH